MVVLASALEVRFDVKRAQRNWTKTRMLKLHVYMTLQNGWVGCPALWSLGWRHQLHE